MKFMSFDALQEQQQNTLWKRMQLSQALEYFVTGCFKLPITLF